MNYRIRVPMHGGEERWFQIRKEEGQQVQGGCLLVTVGGYSRMFRPGDWEQREIEPLSTVRKKHIRARLLKRDGNLCAICREVLVHGEISIDHKKPRALGGTNDENNLRLVHVRCNREKADRYSGRRTTLELGLWLGLLQREEQPSCM